MSSSTRSVTTSPSSEIITEIFDSLKRTERIAFLTPATTFTWAEWIGLIGQLLERYSPLRQARIGLLLRPSGEAYASLIALIVSSCDVFLLDPGMSGPAQEQIAVQYHLDATIDPSGDPGLTASGFVHLGPAPSFAGRGQVTIFTSGSTGQPKPVHHDWNSLTRSVRKTNSTSPQRRLLDLPTSSLRRASGVLALSRQSRDACSARAGGGCRCCGRPDGEIIGDVGIGHAVLLAPPDHAGGTRSSAVDPARTDYSGGRDRRRTSASNT